MAPIVLEVRRGWTDGGLADPAVGGQRGATAFFSVHGQPLLLHSATGRSRWAGGLVGVAEVTAIPSERFVNAYFFTYHGLALWRLDASGVVASHTLLGSQIHVESHPLVSDLNGDGLMDVAVIDSNEETGPALVVLLGQRNGVPVLEGRYRLSSTVDEALAGDSNGDGAIEGRYQVSGTGSEVLAGDLNGDGAADLVVLGRVQSGRYKGGSYFYTKGGAFVFINQNSPPTAVAVESATPSAFILGANFPIRLIRPRPSPCRCPRVPKLWM